MFMMPGRTDILLVNMVRRGPLVALLALMAAQGMAASQTVTEVEFAVANFEAHVTEILRSSGSSAPELTRNGGIYYQGDFATVEFKDRQNRGYVLKITCHPSGNSACVTEMILQCPPDSLARSRSKDEALIASLKEFVTPFGLRHKGPRVELNTGMSIAAPETVGSYFRHTVNGLQGCEVEGASVDFEQSRVWLRGIRDYRNCVEAFDLDQKQRAKATLRAALAKDPELAGARFDTGFYCSFAFESTRPSDILNSWEVVDLSTPAAKHALAGRAIPCLRALGQSVSGRHANFDIVVELSTGRVLASRKIRATEWNSIDSSLDMLADHGSGTLRVDGSTFDVCWKKKSSASTGKPVMVQLALPAALFESGEVLAYQNGDILYIPAKDGGFDEYELLAPGSIPYGNGWLPSPRTKAFWQAIGSVATALGLIVASVTRYGRRSV
jgi:hypothetical protein